MFTVNSASSPVWEKQPNTVMQLTSTFAVHGVLRPPCSLRMLAADYHVGGAEKQRKRAIYPQISVMPRGGRRPRHLRRDSPWANMNQTVCREISTPATLVLRSHLFDEAGFRGIRSSQLRRGQHSGYTGVCGRISSARPAFGEFDHPSFGEASTPATLVLRPHLFGEARSPASLLIPASARPALRLRWCCGRLSSARPALRGNRSSQLLRGRHSGYAGVAAASLRRGPLSGELAHLVFVEMAFRPRWCRGHAGVGATSLRGGRRDTLSSRVS